MMTGKAQSSPPLLLRPTEAARALGIHVQTLANFRHEGRGPQFVKLGSAVRYDADALREYCEANTKTTARRAG